MVMSRRFNCNGIGHCKGISQANVDGQAQGLGHVNGHTHAHAHAHAKSRHASVSTTVTLFSLTIILSKKIYVNDV
jgi:hypothetical protein